MKRKPTASRLAPTLPPPAVVAEFNAQLDEYMDVWTAGVEMALRAQPQRRGKAGPKQSKP